MDVPPDRLSDPTRALTAASAVLFTGLGMVLIVAPAWAAAHFAWSVPPFVAATMGGWCLGNGIIAGLTARVWRWSTVYPAMLYLWIFAAGQLAVLVAFADRVTLVDPLAWLYLAALVVTALSALVGVVDLVRLRPPWSAPGRRVSLALRLFLIGVVVFDTLLAARLAVTVPGGAAGAGGVFPVELSLFTIRAFAAFFGALALAAIPLVWTRSVEPVLHFSRCTLALIVPIMGAAALQAEVFDLAGRPGQWLYLGAYAVVGVATVVALISYRRRRSGDRAAATAA